MGYLPRSRTRKEVSAPASGTHLLRTRRLCQGEKINLSSVRNWACSPPVFEQGRRLEVRAGVPLPHPDGADNVPNAGDVWGVQDMNGYFARGGRSLSPCCQEHRMGW